MRAYRDTGRLAAAESFGSALLNDPATPPDSLALLGVTYSVVKRRQGDFAGMFSICERMAQCAPSCEWTSIAYYWLGLRAWKAGNAAQARSHAQKMLTALGNDCVIFWKEDYAASAQCLLAGLNLTQIPATCPSRPEKLQARLLEIQNDLGAIPN